MSRTSLHVFFVASMLANLSACTSDTNESAVQRSDSAGVEIVVSVGTDHMLEWRFERLFALGGEETGPESFFTVSSALVEADAAGNIYVLNPQSSHIVVFDSDGSFIRGMGGEGGGPGELQGPASLSVSPDGAVAVFDFRKGGFVRFDAHGDVDEEQQFPLFPAPNRQRHFKQLGDTTLVSTTHFSDDMSSQEQVLKQVVASDTLVLAALPLPPAEMAMYESCGGGLRIPPIFAPEVAWETNRGLLAVNHTAEYSITFWTAGQVTRIARRDIAASQASRELAITHLGEGFRINFGRGPCLIEPAEMVDKRGYHESIPLVKTLLMSPSGALWVERFVVDTAEAPPIDVFDDTGAYSGTLLREAFSPVVLLPGDRVGVVEKDEFDVERLVIMAIER